MQLSRITPRCAFIALPFLMLAASPGTAQESNAGFTFSTFTISGAVDLGVESINTPGAISGYYTDSAGDYKGFLRATDGTVTSFSDPGDTGSPGYTIASQINQGGTIVGEFYDDAALTYSGYFRESNGTFKTYNLPGQPQYTTTALYGVNDSGTGFCGFVYPPPYTTLSAFTSFGGTVTIFAVNGSTDSVCTGVNDAGYAVGYYNDSAGVSHGWVRNPSGTITEINVPGAASVLGAFPCGGNAGGTIILGINSKEEMSGHYWDTSFNEHGFILTPAGKYEHVNVPGAFQTGGGGINNKGVMVGHYQDSSCNSTGYIATP